LRDAIVTTGYPRPQRREAARMSATLPAATPVRRSPPATASSPCEGIPWPWLDRTGRFSWLKLSVLLLALTPGAALAWVLATGEMGAEPFKQANREAGLLTIRFLLITLAVTPLRVVADWARIVLVRRMLGLVTLAYALAHVGLYVAHMNFRLAEVAGEIVLRVYLTIGFVALLGLAALGWTSTDGWIKRLGRRWKRLHALVFPIAALGVLHFFLQSKADVTEATLMAGLFLWLLLWRALPAELRGRPFGLFALVPLATLGTAVVEYAWYALATHIPAERVLLANLDLAFGPRPAVIVGMVALGVAALPLLRRAAAAALRPAAAGPG
jgi:sulfoxide reductase heme-binding subunit YedZ